jgi:Fe-S-cluster containining protein
MICLRCGYCCTKSIVVIVKPEFVDEALKIDSFEKAEEVYAVKVSDEVCPHFEQEGVKASCKIHHYKWYKDTPCFSHGQIESSASDNCRMGDYILNKKEV